MKKVIHIEGMHCQHCVASVTKELEALDGVKDVKVNLSKKQAQVQLDKEVADEAMKEAVKKAGFEVTGIEEKHGLFS